MLWKQQKKSVKMGGREWKKKKEREKKRTKRVGAEEACDKLASGSSKQ